MSEIPNDERVAIVAYYGPNDKIATKMVATIFDNLESREILAMEKWISRMGDVREDKEIAEQLADFIRRHNTEHVSITERIIGCPHEEGKDYPEGENCPECPFWDDRNRWTGEKE